MAILVDLSQVIFSGIIVNLSTEITKPGVDAKNLIKHMVFSTLLSLKQKFGSSFGQMILCADSRNYWRREYFPYYKGHRKHDREKSPLDFKMIYEAIDEIKNDIKEHFPYVMLEVDGAEGDDLIACLVKYFQTNEISTTGLMFEEPQRIMILSSDGDFKQLQKYPNVEQWDNQRKRAITSNSPLEDLQEKVASGDTGDGICNVLTGDEWAKLRSEGTEDRVRQTPMKKAVLAEFVAKGIDACKTDEQKANYIRNDTLINFEKIPEAINTKVIDAYKNYVKVGSKKKLMDYFVANKMRLLFANVSDF